METYPTIQVFPETALMDEDQVITVQFLESNQDITIHLKTTLENGTRWESIGCYRTSGNGAVDVSKDPSVQGTYTGVDSLGLFWSMEPEPGFEAKLFSKSDVASPIVYEVYVYCGKQTLEELKHRPKASVVTTKINRWFKDKETKVIKVRQGNVIGILFIPKDIKRLHVPTARTTRYGIQCFRHKEATVWNSLPDNESLQWFANHSLAVPGGIGLVGQSTGGALAHYLSILCQEVKAVVLLNSVPVNRLSKKHAMLSSMFELDRKRIIKLQEGSVMKHTFIHHSERIIESWKSQAKYLCIIGEDDQCVDPCYIENWYSKWPEKQKHRVKFLRFKDAGHHIEPPCIPLTRVSYFRGFFNAYHVWGGRPSAHAFAQKESWKNILSFLRHNLSNDIPLKSNL